MCPEINLKTAFITINKRINSFRGGYRQNIALFSEDDDHLTYFMNNLSSKKPADIVYIRLHPKYINSYEFFKCTAFSLLANYNEPSSSLDELITKSSDILHCTVNFIKETLKQTKILFSDVLELINKFINESTFKCVLVIEEFTYLENIFPNFSETFTQFLILQNKCMVILTSTKGKVAEKIINTKLNLLFGNFEKIFLEKESFLKIYHSLKECLQPLNPSPFFVSFLADILGANSLYHNLFSTIIKNKYNALDEISSLTDIFYEQLSSPGSYFVKKFLLTIENILKTSRESQLFMNILTCVSCGYRRKQEISQLLNLSLKSINKKISRLLQENILTQSGNIIYFKDNLFAFWFANCFKVYYTNSLAGANKSDIISKNSIKEVILHYQQDFLKERTEKIIDLIKTFKNDILLSGNSRINIPEIYRIKTLNYDDNNFFILMAESRELFIFAISNKTLSTETDVALFAEKTKSIRGRKVKKIFIGIGDVSRDAKLAAKTNNFLIWDINFLNNILKLYNKSAIPL